jgi:hypothetical protein
MLNWLKRHTTITPVSGTVERFGAFSNSEHGGLMVLLHGHPRPYCIINGAVPKGSLACLTQAGDVVEFTVSGNGDVDTNSFRNRTLEDRCSSGGQADANK